MSDERFTMPEIGRGATFLFSVAALVAGIIIGTQFPILFQLVTVLVLGYLNSTHAVRSLKSSSEAYSTIFIVFIVALAIGDISYFLQTNDETTFFVKFLNLFKVS